MEPKFEIICDSREQKKLWSNCEVKKLDFGDYSLRVDGVSHEKHFAIERKSLADLSQTVTTGHERFKAELLRAFSAKYFAIVVEGSYTAMETKDYPNAWRSKTPGHVITAIVNTIHMKYKVPVFWCKNRNDSKRLIRGLMRSFVKLQESAQ